MKTCVFCTGQVSSCSVTRLEIGLYIVPTLLCGVLAYVVGNKKVEHLKI